VFAVIGFGRIGRRVADIARALGFRVVVHDHFLSDEEVARQGHRAASLEDALAEAQIVSLHLPLGEATYHVIDAAMLTRMRRGSFLVNTSRGGLIDEEALASALRGGEIGGAALDVFEHEPLPASSSLLEAPNLLLTPHAAWYSAESLAELPREAARNVLAFFSGESAGQVSRGA
jgi:D-3-phosphoglycerate dehydrogenase